ncbi:hypothetical protein OEZ86_013108 [Tetradesmus obliquus]|nr:hypothetical protein OEZ86_013108 [Tetradesmus obliquus]
MRRLGLAATQLQQAAHSAPDRLPQAVLAASSLLWSAALGNQQVTWSSFQQAIRHHSSSSDTAASPESTQQQQLHQDAAETASTSTPAAAAAAAAAAATGAAARRSALSAAAFNFDDARAEPFAALQQQQQQQQQQLAGGLPLLRSQGSRASVLATTAAAAAAPASSGQTLQLQLLFPQQQQQQQQQQQSVQRQTRDSTSSSSSSSSSSGPDAYQGLLQLIVAHPERLLPWQRALQPTGQQLQQHERLKLSGSQKGNRISDEAYDQLLQLLRRFCQSRALAQQARAAQVPKALLPHASSTFRKYMQRAATPGFTAALFMAAAAPPAAPDAAADDAAAGSEQQQQQQQQGPGGMGYTPAVEALLMPYFLEFCQQQYKQEIEAYAAAVATLDLRSPHTWYPYARSIQRKIIYHGGPTNSGKTYNALQALAAAERGVYCAPLRLLAMEVYETLNHMGVYCDLVTGQEVLRVPGSGHVACTVEMASLGMHADVAVIDEIQLIGDDQRGFAWSRALLGLPANTIHVCGDTSAVPLVRYMAALCGDEFELHTYERMTPLRVDPAGLPNGWADVAPGDAVVAFSRKDIYSARKAIEAATGQRTCIVYGALPAETRRQQARLFNDPHSGANILIASDAIGLGLNFNIRRVIFTTMQKFARGGRGKVPVPVSLVKQISGRAGRRNSIYPEGCVTTLHARDLRTLQKALAVPLEKLATPAAGLAPEYETVELLSAQFPELSLQALLRKLDAEARLDGRYFLCNQEQLLETAHWLGKVPGLSLPEQFTLVNAPIDPFDPRQRGAFLEFTGAYAAGQPVLFNEGLMPAGPPASEPQMADAESLHKILGLWLWLSYRCEEGTFPGRERVQAMARQISHWLNLGLQNIQSAAAAAAVKGLAAAVSAVERPDSSSSVDSSSDGADSSDADEINESVFRTPVVEVAAAGSAAAAQAALGSSDDAAEWQQQQQQQQQQQREELQPVPYINWGSSVSVGMTGPASSSGSAVFRSTGSSSSSSGLWGEEAAVGPERLLPSAESLETSYAAGTNHSVEVLERLIMPEYDPSMAPFVRWRTRPRFRPPPAPTAAAAAGGGGGGAAAMPMQATA